ncbi:hypothetical protein ACFO0O_08655 [Cobetia amphilecti]|uniref:hypothetical protein n=1 Tax=Cobetia TaxID=204286 RepID=UPI00338F68DD
MNATTGQVVALDREAGRRKKAFALGACILSSPPQRSEGRVHRATGLNARRET